MICYSKKLKKVKQEIRLEEKNPFRSINIMKDIFTVCYPRISAQLPCFTGIDCKKKTIDKLYKPCLKIYPANGTCLIAFANEVGHQVMFTRGELLGIFLVRTNSSNLKKKIAQPNPKQCCDV